MNSKTNIQTV